MNKDIKIDKRIKEVLFWEDEIVTKIKSYGKIIDDYYKDKEAPIFLGILKGCVLFYTHLLTATTIESETEFIKVSSYKKTKIKNSINIQWDLSTPIMGRNILIIEDVVDSGKTLKKLYALLKLHGAKDIKIITLLDKPKGRKTKLEVDWALFTLTNVDQFVVGWGFDLDESMRNLPYIGLLKKEYE